MRAKIIKPTGEPVGTIELEDVPAVGDHFRWEQNDLVRVVKRTWLLVRNDDEDRVILEVVPA